MSAQQSAGEPENAAPAERWQHGQEALVLNRRQYVRDGVVALVRSGKIGPAEWRAADKWYRDYSLAEGGPAKRGDFGASVSTTYNSRTPADAIIDARTSLREACAAVGAMGTALLRMFVAEQLGYSRIAERQPFDKLTGQDVKGAVIYTLSRLAEFYSPPVNMERGNR